MNIILQKQNKLYARKYSHTYLVTVTSKFIFIMRSLNFLTIFSASNFLEHNYLSLVYNLSNWS